MSVTGLASSTGIDLGLGASVNDLTLFGAAPIAVRDNANNNTITGNDGDNTISVSSGADVVHGNAGTDRLVVDYSSVTAIITGTLTSITDGATHSVTYDGIEDVTLTTGSGKIP